jgi:hypothetical protein
MSLALMTIWTYRRVHGIITVPMAKTAKCAVLAMNDNHKLYRITLLELNQHLEIYSVRRDIRKY